MNSNELKEKVAKIDESLKDLYLERMNLTKDIVKAKKENAYDDLNQSKETLLKLTEGLEPAQQLYLKKIYEALFETSRAYETEAEDISTNLVDSIKTAIKNETMFPVRAKVACQGIKGAYSSIAASKFFEIADISYFKNFENVFQAVEKGFCEYGVLPIENSYAGSVNPVYDLMKEHKFYIVKSLKLQIKHNLVANTNAKLENIKEVYSHEQALSQCKKYLEKYPNIKITPCPNTAVAARMVKESGRDNIAAISSQECAEIYGLKVLDASIQDSNDNYTRFILIAKDIKVYNNANKISIVTSLPNTPGSLYKLLSRFYNLGINMTKLESRPMPNSSFEFIFYFDLDCDIKSKATQNLIAELDQAAIQFTFLGAYSEI